ncbi:MAG: AmmeMemoRadiSam system protein B [bacterium]
MKRITLSLLGLAWFLQIAAAPGDAAAESRIHKSTLAGTWYDGDASTLTKQIEGFFKKAPETPPNPDRARALIVPHAGYTWSGDTAAYAYKAVRGQPVKRVIVMGPSHHVAIQGGSIPDFDAYETPLGIVKLDTAACKQLLEIPGMKTVPAAHEEEHSVEIQLPFLQSVFQDFSLVPIVIGEISPENCVAIANAVKPLLDSGTLLVMSSDFTHQGRRFGYIPFKDKVKENVQRLDFAAVNHILQFDVLGLWRFLERTQATICGRNPILIGLMALPMQTQVEFLRYATSGDKTGDYDESVSYCSLLFREQPDYLNEEEAGRLLAIARTTLENTLKGQKPAVFTPPEDQITERMKAKKGIFVTLKEKGDLRGCIGHMEGEQPLYQEAARTVLLSALRDRRFEPVKPNELQDIEIEISVLSPLKSVPSWREIMLGRDGMVLAKGNRQALFLPQVALEQGWTIEETLSHLCLKAGLDVDDWKSGCAFQTFTAQVFGETYRDLKKP